MDTYAPLLARGINRRVIEQASIVLCTRYGYPYWRYPVRDLAGAVISWRYKRAGDDRSRRKYDWGTEELPAAADAVYNLAAVVEGKTAVVAAGEPDVWLLASLRVRACSLLAGEGSVPEAAVGALAERRPLRVLVLYDNDACGRQGAQKLVLALRARTLDCVARTLPDDVGTGGDVTDLFGLLGRDRERFFAVVRSLPELVAAPEPKSAPPASAVGHKMPLQRERAPADQRSPIERFKARYALADVIEAAGVTLRPHQGSAYLQGRCPFHDDHDPSFVVWPERGYFKCYGCLARGDVLDFVERMEACELAQRPVAV